MRRIICRGIAIVSLLLLVVGCAESVALEGVEWRVATLDGAKITGSDPDSYTLTFGEESKFSGKGECNRVMGDYTIMDGKRLKVERKGATMMFCPNIEQEERFFKVLDSVTRYETKGGELQLFADDKLVVTLTAKEE